MKGLLALCAARPILQTRCWVHVVPQHFQFGMQMQAELCISRNARVGSPQCSSELPIYRDWADFQKMLTRDCCCAEITPPLFLRNRRYATSFLCGTGYTKSVCVERLVLSDTEVHVSIRGVKRRGFWHLKFLPKLAAAWFPVTDFPSAVLCCCFNNSCQNFLHVSFLMAWW